MTVFNYSELHFAKVTFYKIHTLVVFLVYEQQCIKQFVTFLRNEDESFEQTSDRFSLFQAVVAGSAFQCISSSLQPEV